jgi:hypothetical protein
MSKTLMAMFMYELQRRIDADLVLSNIAVLSVDPGGMGTGIARDAPFPLPFLLRWVFPAIDPLIRLIEYIQPNGSLRRPATSAAHLRRACFDEKEPLGKHPKAIALNGSAVGAHQTPEVLDEKKQEELWLGSLKYAGVVEGDTVLKNWA